MSSNIQIPVSSASGSVVKVPDHFKLADALQLVMSQEGDGLFPLSGTITSGPLTGRTLKSLNGEVIVGTGRKVKVRDTVALLNGAVLTDRNISQFDAEQTVDLTIPANTTKYIILRAKRIVGTDGLDRADMDVGVLTAEDALPADDRSALVLASVICGASSITSIDTSMRKYLAGEGGSGGAGGGSGTPGTIAIWLNTSTLGTAATDATAGGTSVSLTGAPSIVDAAAGQNVNFTAGTGIYDSCHGGSIGLNGGLIDGSSGSYTGGQVGLLSGASGYVSNTARLFLDGGKRLSDGTNHGGDVLLSAGWEGSYNGARVTLHSQGFDVGGSFRNCDAIIEGGVRSPGAGDSGAVVLRTASADRVIVGADGSTQFNGKIRIANSATPSSSSDTGTTGDIAWDSNYMYTCIATNTWKRAALSTW